LEKLQQTRNQHHDNFPTGFNPGQCMVKDPPSVVPPRMTRMPKTVRVVLCVLIEKPDPIPTSYKVLT